MMSFRNIDANDECVCYEDEVSGLCISICCPIHNVEEDKYIGG